MNQRRIQGFIAIVGVLLPAGVLVYASPPSLFTLQTKIHALTGTDGPLGPGLGPGSTFFAGFGGRPPVVNSDGTIAFLAPVNGGTNRGIWRVDPGQSPKPVVLLDDDGALGPGLGPNSFFRDLQQIPRISDQGDILFQGQIARPGPIGADGVWIVESTGVTRPLAITGTDGIYGPGLGPGVTYKEFRDSLITNSSSDVAYYSIYHGPGNNGGGAGYWRSQAGGIPQIVGRIFDDGALGPALGPGVEFRDFVGIPAMDAQGSVYTAATVLENGAPGPREQVVAKLNSSGPNQTLVQSSRTGILGPNLSELAYQPSGFLSPKVNRAGQVVLGGNMIGVPREMSPVLTFEDAGIPRHIVAQGGVEGPLGPQLGPGITFSFFESIVLGGGGHIAMIARFHNMLDDAGVFLIPPGGVPTAYALTDTDGPLGPGLGSGVAFGSFNAPEFFADDFPLTNSRGDLVFRGVLFGPGIDHTNNVGLWIVSNGVKTLLERTGSLKDVDPTIGTDLRTISGISVLSGSGGQDGAPSAFTDQRLLVYELSFTDGSSGIFTVQVIPEPSTLVLATAVLCATCRRRQNRPSKTCVLR